MLWSNIGSCSIILSVLLALGKSLHRQGNKSSSLSHYSFPDVNITSDLTVAGSDSEVINSSRGKPTPESLSWAWMEFTCLENNGKGRNWRIKCSLNIGIMYILTCQLTQSLQVIRCSFRHWPTRVPIQRNCTAHVNEFTVLWTMSQGQFSKSNPIEWINHPLWLVNFYFSLSLSMTQWLLMLLDWQNNWIYTYNE